MPLIIGLRFSFDDLQRKEEVIQTRSLDCNHPRNPAHRYCPECGGEFGRTTTHKEEKVIMRQGFEEAPSTYARHQLYTFQWRDKTYPVMCSSRYGTRRYEYFLIVKKETNTGMIDLSEAPTGELLEELLEELYTATGACEYGVYNLLEIEE